MMNLCFSGNKSVTDCLYSLSPAILDGFCTVSIEQPLISEELKQELNPLVIKIESCTCLPTRPVPIHELKVLFLEKHFKVKH